MKKRILSRMFARELNAAELGIPAGGTVVVARTADSTDEPSGPPVSTLLATLPDYSEDR